MSIEENTEETITTIDTEAATDNNAIISVDEEGNVTETFVATESGIVGDTSVTSDPATQENDDVSENSDISDISDPEEGDEEEDEDEEDDDEDDLINNEDDLINNDEVEVSVASSEYADDEVEQRSTRILPPLTILPPRVEKKPSKAALKKLEAEKAAEEEAKRTVIVRGVSLVS